ncbi:MAG: fructose-1,6-bisphosphatase [Prevotella sp.]|nr:fructose-1,6-bisphosphatase [Prevotella sp.]MCM1074445.1 fructose-1,6-bisphosphatase [Ruminococcus sp.]
MSLNITPEDLDLHYLQLLSKSFPTIAAASTEIINLEAILNLPKGTEHFLTDIHGEDQAFRHVLKNASGTIRRKVDEIFGTSMREEDRQELCTLIYYPQEKLKLVTRQEKNMDEWYQITLNRLVKVCQNISSKYTRSKVNKALPKDFSYIIQELLHETEADPNKSAYFAQIIHTIISTQRAEAFIVELSHLIQRLAIDSLHIVGDIYDRGPGAHIIMDTLCNYHNVDIQWGNHDLLWMGAYAGNEASMANVVRISLRYANLDTLEEGYGINLLPLATFAMETYADTPLEVFNPKIKFVSKYYTNKELRIISQMHKAISVMQWKLEAAIIARNPEYGMDDRNRLHLIDFEKGTVNIDGVEYEMKDTDFPTIDPTNPYELTEDEQSIIRHMHQCFVGSEKLRLHIRCMLHRGSFYLARNNNLLFHASIPLNEDGTFKTVVVAGEPFKGKALLDRLDRLVQHACRKGDDENPLKKYSVDYMWYLWCGPESPSFDKSQMATFERYLLSDKEPQKEVKGWYYRLSDSEDTCRMILEEFGLNPETGHIINGHVPVKIIKGEKPVKAGGKLLVIDGGFSKAYQPETGIAGYTLVSHSRGLQLVQHNPFESRQKAIEEGRDIISNTVLSQWGSTRLRVRDTDMGRDLQTQVRDLHHLLYAYRRGLVREGQK